METSKRVFWDDLARDLEDPEFLRAYVVESVRISTIDQVVIALNDAREAAGLSKAALARAISAQPAAMRRLFSAGQVNPTLGTLAEVAAALGMRITVEPLPVTDRNQVTTPLLEGRSADTQTLVEHLAGMRTPPAPGISSQLTTPTGQARQRGFLDRYSSPKRRTFV